MSSNRVTSALEKDGWRAMSSAPRDGSVILVCELVAGREKGQVLPACYMRASGDPMMEGFWAAGPTSRVPDHLLAKFPNDDGVAVGWRKLALTPLCWKPLPEPEDLSTLRRREGQILARVYGKTGS